MEEPTPDAIFKAMGSVEGKDTPLATVRDFLSKLADSPLSAAQIDLGLDTFTEVLTKDGLLAMVQEFMKCVKEIAITNIEEIATSKLLRKLVVGEIVEVFEPGKPGPIQRIKIRAINDGVEGWVTVKGNQGTTFLEKTAAPPPEFLAKSKELKKEVKKEEVKKEEPKEEKKEEPKEEK